MNDVHLASCRAGSLCRNIQIWNGNGVYEFPFIRVALAVGVGVDIFDVTLASTVSQVCRVASLQYRCQGVATIVSDGWHHTWCQCVRSHRVFRTSNRLGSACSCDGEWLTIDSVVEFPCSRVTFAVGVGVDVSHGSVTINTGRNRCELVLVTYVIAAIVRYSRHHTWR